MRSFSLPRLHITNQPEHNAPDMGSPYQHSSAHSRDSSAGSSTSSPVTPTFSASTRGHSRWPSSSSSLVTNPDSPSIGATPKSTLHDLVEEPAERDESSFDSLRDTVDEPLCICDTPFCEHRQSIKSRQSMVSPPEWSPGDDYFDDGHLPGQPLPKRRRSGGQSTDSLTSRLSRRFPSISKRFQGHRSSASVSSTPLRSAPTSRSSSLRLPNTRSVTLPASTDMRIGSTPPFSPARTDPSDRSVSPPRARASSQAASRPLPIEIEVPLPEEDEAEREELASTPLLPPMMATYFNESNDTMQSPLQSPTVASNAASIANTPLGTPNLSARPSVSSLRNARSNPVQQSSEIPHLTIAEETDPWAIKLGHANFHITPEPYMPTFSDAQSCKRLAADWEAARVEYMRQAARVSEYYGVTSQTYKLTEQKWAEIDAVWRANHEAANAEAQAKGESPIFQPLEETQPVSKMPSLNDPKQPFKFPNVEEKDIVGPMVRYAKIHHERQPSSNKPSFLRLFTDPASLLGRPSLSLRK